MNSVTGFFYSSAKLRKIFFLYAALTIVFILHYASIKFGWHLSRGNHKINRLSCIEIIVSEFTLGVISLMYFFKTKFNNKVSNTRQSDVLHYSVFYRVSS